MGLPAKGERIVHNLKDALIVMERDAELMMAQAIEIGQLKARITRLEQKLAKSRRQASTTNGLSPIQE